MKRPWLPITAMVCGATLALPALGSGAVVNGSFETGVGVDADNWNELQISGGSSTATTTRIMSNPLVGDYAMFLEVVGTPDFGPVAEIQQQTLVGSILAGTSYDFSFQSKGVAGPGSVGFYEVLWFDGDASNGGGPQGAAVGLQNFSLGANYALNQNTNLIAPAGADSALVQIRLVTGAFDGASGTAFIDDVRFDLSGGPVAPPAFPSGINILANPGFELGTGGDADNWDELPGPNGTVTRNPSMPSEGAFGAYIEFDNTVNPAGGAHFIQQNLGAGTITDDTVNYDLAFAAKVDSTNFLGQDVFVQLQWLDQDGSDGGGVKGELLQQLVPLGISADYQNFIFSDLDVPDGTDSYLLRFQFSAGAVDGIVNGLYVDNAYLGAVPEPASMALLLIGGGLIALGRPGRRKAAQS